MKLYEIPRGSKIRVPIKHTVTGEEKVDEITFYNVDGMYSYCETSDQVPVHIGASTELKLGDDGVYELKK